MFFKPTQVNIGSMKINSLGQGCRCTFSQTVQTDINNRMKRNENFENNSDRSIFIFPVQGVIDSDLIDMVNRLNRKA